MASTKASVMKLTETIEVAIGLLESDKVPLAIKHLKMALKTKNGKTTTGKRVASAYNIFMGERIKEMKDIPHKERMAQLSGMWKTLPES